MAQTRRVKNLLAGILSRGIGFVLNQIQFAPAKLNLANDGRWTVDGLPDDVSSSPSMLPGRKGNVDGPERAYT